MQENCTFSIIPYGITMSKIFRCLFSVPHQHYLSPSFVSGTTIIIFQFQICTENCENSEKSHFSHFSHVIFAWRSWRFWRYRHYRHFRQVIFSLLFPLSYLGIVSYSFVIPWLFVSHFPSICLTSPFHSPRMIKSIFGIFEIYLFLSV